MAERPEAAIERDEDRRLALVLGGGGGRGGAHLGVLATLQALGLPIDLLVGTSIGGVIGVLHAAGCSPAAVAAAFDGKTLWDIYGPDPGGAGLIGSRHLRALLDGLLGGRTFADLAIPCAVVATDLVTGRTAVFDRGPLIEALLATTALPGLFPPMARDGMLLADGGITNNLPVDVALARGARRVIAVDLGILDTDFAPPTNGHAGWHWPDPRPQVPLAIAHRALTVLIAQLTRYHLAEAPPDLLLRPAVAAIGTLDMGHLAEAHAAGVAAAEAARDDLLALRRWRLGEASATPNQDRLPGHTTGPARARR